MQLSMNSLAPLNEEPLTDEELHSINERMADINTSRVYDADEVRYVSSIKQRKAAYQ